MAWPGEQGAGDVTRGDLAILGTLHDQGNVLPPSVTTGVCPWTVTQGRAWPNRCPGRNSHRMATSPDTPSTRRVSSVHGSGRPSRRSGRP